MFPFILKTPPLSLINTLVRNLNYTSIRATGRYLPVIKSVVSVISLLLQYYSQSLVYYNPPAYFESQFSTHQQSQT